MKAIILISLCILLLVGCKDNSGGININKVTVYDIQFDNDTMEVQLHEGCNYAVFEGVSMLPTIRTGNIAILCPIIDEIKVNDIVCMNVIKYCERRDCRDGVKNYDYDCHRVIDIGDLYYTTQGDSAGYLYREHVLREELDFMIVGVFY